MSGVRKRFFSIRRHNCGMPQISLISTDIFTKREKSAILLHFCFFVFFYLKGSNVDATSLSDFIDKNA